MCAVSSSAALAVSAAPVKGVATTPLWKTGMELFWDTSATCKAFV